MKRVAWVISALVINACSLFAAPGTPCTKHEECSGLKDGYCAKAELCTRDCTADGECPMNSTCSDQRVRKVCLPNCEQDSTCLAGFVCRDGVCQVKSPLSPPP